MLGTAVVLVGVAVDVVVVVVVVAVVNGGCLVLLLVESVAELRTV